MTRLTHQDVVNLLSAADQVVRTEIERSLHPERLRKGGDEHLASLASMLERVSPHHVSHSTLRALRRKKLAPGRTHSFYHRLSVASSRTRNKGLFDYWKLNDIHRAYRFVDALNVRRPLSLGGPVAFGDLDLATPCVVKPLEGTSSRGCYLVYDSQHIVHVKDKTVLNSLAELSQHANSLMSPQRKSWRLRDQWVVEELVLEDSESRTPARDYKFYAFYGRIHLVQEIVRHPELKISYSTRRSSGFRPRDPEAAMLFDGGVVEDAHFSLIERISAAMPAPFMRIDMLASGDGLVFGEFTPSPGNSSDFTRPWDRALGEAWHDAEVRLMKDLVRGKDFWEFRHSTSKE